MSERDIRAALRVLRSTDYAELADDELDQLVRAACDTQLRRKGRRLTLASFLGAAKVFDRGCVSRISWALSDNGYDDVDDPVSVEGFRFQRDTVQRVLTLGPSKFYSLPNVGPCTLLAVLWSLAKHEAVPESWRLRPGGMLDTDWEAVLEGKFIDAAQRQRWSRREEGKPFADEVTVRDPKRKVSDTVREAVEASHG